jgi:hypothetical protein
MFKFLKGLFTFADGTGDSKTAVGVVLLTAWQILKGIFPEWGLALSFLDEILIGYTGVAAVDRSTKVINALGNK